MFEGSLRVESRSFFRGGGERTWKDLIMRWWFIMGKVSGTAGLGRRWSDSGEDVGLNSAERASSGWGCTEGGKSDDRKKPLKALPVWETGRTRAGRQPGDLFIAHLA